MAIVRKESLSSKHEMNRIAIIGFVILFYLASVIGMRIVAGSESILADIKDTVTFLASDELEGREFGKEGGDKAANFVAEKFKEIGLVPAGDEIGGYFQRFEHKTRWTEENIIGKNVIGLIPGKSDEEYIVVGAHYDHLGMGTSRYRNTPKDNVGKIHPGANDNASGVAALLEVAKRFMGSNFKPDRSIVVVAFDGEERGLLGSKHYVSHMPKGCIGMVCMDTIGGLRDGPIVILGTQSSKEWLDILKNVSVDVHEKIDFLDRLGASDNVNFLNAGIPAIMFFSGLYLEYHSPEDTVDRLNIQGIIRIVNMVEKTVEFISRKDSELVAGPLIKDKPPTKRIKISIGTIPDFLFKGEGYRLAGVKSNSPAEASGLRAGDVIIKIDQYTVNGLSGLVGVMTKFSPGDKVSVIFLREDKEITVSLVLKPK